MRKALIVATMMLALALPSFAAEEKGHASGEKKEGHGEKAGEAAKKGKPGTNVDLPYLMAPLTNPDGKLLGYAYLSSRLTATSEGVVTAVREKLPFIQDAMLRNVNADPISTPDDPEKVDIVGVEKRLLAEAAKVMGAGKIKVITLCTVQISEIRPKETPALHSPPEEMAAHGPPPKNPVKSRCES
jgi:hypothetical protein